LARWEGVLGRDLYKEGWWQDTLQLEPGWQIFPLAAAQNLDRADAFWSARRLSRTAVEAIENTVGWTGYGRNPHITAPYREILQHASRRYEECIENLAWDLRESCQLEEPNFRPDVAALFWTLGDVPHAHLLRDTTCMPSLQAVGGLVRRSLQVMHVDPALQEIWLRLKDRPPFSLREHRELFVSINLNWAPISSRIGPAGGQHQVDLLSISEPPSQAYAAAVTEYFRTGMVKETIQRLGQAHIINSDALMMWAPEALHRMRSLLTLTDKSDFAAQPSQADRWTLLAKVACAIVEQRERDIRDAYERSTFLFITWNGTAQPRSLWLLSLPNATVRPEGRSGGTRSRRPPDRRIRRRTVFRAANMT